jgi:hypothetical protein
VYTTVSVMSSVSFRSYHLVYDIYRIWPFPGKQGECLIWNRLPFRSKWVYLWLLMESILFIFSFRVYSRWSLFFFVFVFIFLAQMIVLLYWFTYFITSRYLSPSLWCQHVIILSKRYNKNDAVLLLTKDHLSKECTVSLIVN